MLSKRTMSVPRKPILAAALFGATLAALGWYFGDAAKQPRDARDLSPGATAAEKDEAYPDAFRPRGTLLVTIPVLEGVREGRLSAELVGNGRDQLHVRITNLTDREIRALIPQGTVLKAGRKIVAPLREAAVAVPAKGTVTEQFKTIALRSSNAVGDVGYEITPEREPRLDAFFAHVAENLHINPQTAQTAALALLENLPLRAFARFPMPGIEIPSRVDTTAYKVDTADIVAALALLRELGIPDDRLALTIDPQLKIEAMTDPLAHALAVKYYGIKDEWAYWKRELLEGDPSTRHYALYGIARFYPDVAIQMLPQWARETRTDIVYRISAVQALAETGRVEALSVLRQLMREFGTASEIGKTAQVASAYLDIRLTRQIVQRVPYRAVTNEYDSLPEPIPPVLASVPAR